MSLKCRQKRSFCGADPKQSPQKQRWRMCDAAGLLHQFLKAASCMDEPFSIARIPAAAQARHTVGSSGVKPEHANRALTLPIGFARASRSLFHTFPDVTADG